MAAKGGGFISKLYLALLLMVSGFLIVVLQFGFIFLLVALLPSMVAYFVDLDPQKSKFKVVFSCNLAATFPTLAPMFQAGIQLRRYDISVLTSNPDIWLIIYGGAAAGWCLLYLCNQLAYFVVGARNEYIIRNIEDEQKRLVSEWGVQVQGAPPSQKR
jgi:hypothetical protein